MSRPVVALIQLGRTWVNVEAIETVDVYAEPDPRDKTTQISATRVRLRSGATVFDDRPIRDVLEAMRAVYAESSTDDFPHAHPELDPKEPFVQQSSVTGMIAELIEHLTDGSHWPVQHRDGKEPWCGVCRLNAKGQPPVSMIGNHPTGARQPDGIRGERTAAEILAEKRRNEGRTLHIVEDDPAPRSMSVLPVRGPGEGLSE